jgi:hypothetical protein
VSISNPTILSTTTASDGNNTLASNSVSPAANSLVVVIAMWAAASADVVTPYGIGDTFSGGLSWTKHVEAERNTASRGASVVIWTAPAGASPGSGVITATGSNNSNRRVLQVIEVASGFNAASPVNQFKGAVDSDVDPFVLTLDSTPDSDSLVIYGSAHRGSAAVTGDAAYVLLDGTSAGSNSDSVTQYQNGGSPDTTIETNNTSTDSSSGPDAAAAIEIDMAAAAAAKPSTVPLTGAG